MAAMDNKMPLPPLDSLNDFISDKLLGLAFDVTFAFNSAVMFDF